MFLDSEAVTLGIRFLINSKIIMKYPKFHFHISIFGFLGFDSLICTISSYLSVLHIIILLSPSLWIVRFAFLNSIYYLFYFEKEFFGFLKLLTCVSIVMHHVSSFIYLVKLILCNWFEWLDFKSIAY